MCGLPSSQKTGRDTFERGRGICVVLAVLRWRYCCRGECAIWWYTTVGRGTGKSNEDICWIRHWRFEKYGR